MSDSRLSRRKEALRSKTGVHSRPRKDRSAPDDSSSWRSFG